MFEPSKLQTYNLFPSSIEEILQNKSFWSVGMYSGAIPSIFNLSSAHVKGWWESGGKSANIYAEHESMLENVLLYMQAAGMLADKPKTWSRESVAHWISRRRPGDTVEDCDSYMLTLTEDEARGLEGELPSDFTLSTANCCQQLYETQDGRWVNFLDSDGSIVVLTNHPELISRKLDAKGLVDAVMSGEGVGGLLDELQGKDEAFKKVVRGGKIVKKNIVRVKKMRTPAQKQAMVKAQRKAQTPGAKLSRKKSVKVRTQRGVK